MKLYKRMYEVLCCRKNLKLKQSMGFSITLSDIETIPWWKKQNRREGIMNIKQYLHKLENYLMFSVIEAGINLKEDTCIKEKSSSYFLSQIDNKSEQRKQGKTYTKSLKRVSKQGEPYVNRKNK